MRNIVITIEEIYAAAQRMIHDGDIAQLKLLLRKHPELVYSRDLPDGRGMQNTLLHEVTGMGTLTWSENAPAIAQLLIESGAPLNVRERPDFGETPLHHAVSINNAPVAKVLLEAGANPELKGRYDGIVDSALGYALFYGTDERLESFRVNCPELLIRYGAELKLPFAAALGDLKKIKAFFSANPNLSAVDKKPPSNKMINLAFLFASKYGNLEVATFLFKKGAEINARISFFNQEVTALHVACETGRSIPLIRFLLKNGADPTIKDGVYNATPEGWAMFCGRDKVYRLMRNSTYNS